MRFRARENHDDAEQQHNRGDRASLALLESLHQRWLVLLRSLAPSDWQKKLRHPESGLMTLDKALSIYGWHGRHHVAHITSLRERNGWR